MKRNKAQAIEMAKEAEKVLKYEIYQIQKEYRREWGFIGLDMLKRLGGTVQIERYNKVYAGELPQKFENVDQALEELFRIFNIERPADFKGHSLSVSDIVEINGKLYYCDSFGWQEI